MDSIRYLNISFKIFDNENKLINTNLVEIENKFNKCLKELTQSNISSEITKIEINSFNLS